MTYRLGGVAFGKQMRRALLMLGMTAALAAMLPNGAGAQGGASSSSSSSRDTARVRLHLKRAGDTIYMQEIRATTREEIVAKLRSLERELDRMAPDAPDRPQRVGELNWLIRFLRELDQPATARKMTGELGAELAGDIARAVARAQAAAGTFAMRSYVRALPQGFIGITVQAPHDPNLRGDSAYVRYFTYPEIVSVDPDSPADRAGITRGDRLVAYNGMDVRKGVNLTRLLQPQRRLTVTVLRDGEERRYPLVVARDSQRLLMRRRQSVPDDSARAASVGGPRMRVIPRGASVVAGSPPGFVLFDKLDATDAPVAGANVAEITSESLGHYFGVSRGILVTAVFADPARGSGLKGGDVITRADGRDVATTLQLRRILEAHHDDRAVELEIVREQRTRTVTLRW